MNAPRSGTCFGWLFFPSDTGEITLIATISFVPDECKQFLFEQLKTTKTNKLEPEIQEEKKLPEKC